MVDSYQGCEDQYDIQLLGCWANARRTFIEAQKGTKG